MIKAFVFDIGNVLLAFDLSIALRKLGEKSGIDTLLQAMEPVKHAYESGGIGRGEFLEQMRAALHYTGTEAELIAAWEDIFAENHVMSGLVRALHGSYPLFLLSNTNDIHMDYLFRTYPVFGLFRDGVYSHSAKRFKPDPGIFETALRQFGIEARETVYIDDLQPNVDAALALGFHAIRYDHNRHDDLVSRLGELGVRV